MTFINNKKNPVAYDPKVHDLFVNDFYLCRDGVYVARIRGEWDHVVWVKANKITLPDTPTERVEPIELAVSLKLHVKTWIEVRTELQRILRRSLRHITRCVRDGRKIEKT